MSSASPRSSARRCQPWLGTYVEVWCEAESDTQVASAITAGFSAIARVQDLMSFHSTESDVARMNARAHEMPVAVDTSTHEVLSLALQIARESNGLFDITVASQLVSWGILPGDVTPSPDGEEGNWKDIALLPGNRVRFSRPLQVDLGGIAKGYAVDQAVRAMQRAGALSGGVNAGGDIRVFGARSERVMIRNPEDPGVSGGTLELRDAALATSASTFSEMEHQGSRVNHLVNPVTRRPAPEGRSVTVVAPTCAVADALTKVVLFSEADVSPLLARHQARAFLLDRGAVDQAV